MYCKRLCTVEAFRRDVHMFFLMHILLLEFGELHQTLRDRSVALGTDPKPWVFFQPEPKKTGRFSSIRGEPGGRRGESLFFWGWHQPSLKIQSYPLRRYDWTLLAPT